MSRVAASTALRSVILAATACSGAASAATSAADELAELRKDFRRSVEQRDARRSSSAPYLGFSRSYLQERDPESFARVEEQSKAAQERAEAALRGHRQTRLALRPRVEAAKKDAEGAETDTIERSRRETATAITKTAEVRTELAASQLALTEEQQARRRLAEEMETLNARIRQTEAEAALVRAELDGTRASEAASLSKIREELQGARSQILSEAEAALKAQEASKNASAASAAATAEAVEARAAREQEAATASSLRQSLKEAMAEAAEAKSVCGQQADASAQVLQLEHAEAQALTALSRDSMQHELSEMLVARREQAARRLVSSLLAGSFEGFLRTALRAWRKVQAEAALMRAELDGTRASEAASLSKLREELQGARSHMLSEAEAAIKAQEMLTTLSHEPVQSWRHELSEMFMARREQAARRLVSSLLASSFEVFLRAALRAWWKAKADANAMASSLVLMRFFSAWCQKVASRQEKLLRRVVSAWAAYAAHNGTELSRAGGAANAPAARHPTPSSGSSSGAAAAAWDRFHDMDLDSEPEL